MTPLAPSSPSPGPGSTRVRVRWDNIMIVLIGIAVAAFAGVAILIGGTNPTAQTGPTSATTPTTASTEANAEPAVDGALSLDDARGLVEEARTLMAEARWDEAAERLALVPDDLREESGASTAELELTTKGDRHKGLRAELEAAVEARRWQDAKLLLADLAAIAPLDEPLLEQERLVLQALAPAQPAEDEVTTPVATKRPATQSTTSGGGSASGSTASQPTAKPKPQTNAGTTTRPKPATTPTTGTKPPVAAPSTGTGIADALPTELTDGLTAAEQAELEQALGQALGAAQ